MVLFEAESAPIPDLREVAPALPPEVGRRLYERLRDEDARVRLEGGAETFADALCELIAEWDHDPHSLMLRTTCLLVADLIEQGWDFQIGIDRVTLKPPGLEPGPGITREEIKQRIRRALRAGRDRQLQEPSVRQFIQRMERPFRRAQGRFSIFDVIDDGRELERQCLKTRQLPREVQERQLARLIDPVVVACETGAKCTATGLSRIDIWRYFRHTWSLEIPVDPGATTAAADP